MADIFISYSRRDEEFVERLRKSLAEQRQGRLGRPRGHRPGGRVAARDRARDRGLRHLRLRHLAGRAALRGLRPGARPRGGEEEADRAAAAPRARRGPGPRGPREPQLRLLPHRRGVRTRLRRAARGDRRPPRVGARAHAAARAGRGVGARRPRERLAAPRRRSARGGGLARRAGGAQGAAADAAAGRVHPRQPHRGDPAAVDRAPRRRSPGSPSSRSRSSPCSSAATPSATASSRSGSRSRGSSPPRPTCSSQIDPELSVLLAERAASDSPTVEAERSAAPGALGLARRGRPCAATGRGSATRRSAPTASAWSPRAATAAAGSGTPRTGENIAWLPHDARVSWADFSPERRPRGDRQPRPHRPDLGRRTGEPVTRPRPGTPRPSAGWSSAPTGGRVVTTSGDATARIWNPSTGAQLAVLRGHRTRVTDAAYTDDGRTIVTGSDDGTVRVWDASVGRAVSRSCPRRLGPALGGRGRPHRRAGPDRRRQRSHERHGRGPGSALRRA